jgi:hypothetical protein
MTKRTTAVDSEPLPEDVMRRMLEVAMEFHRLSPWKTLSDVDFIGCRDERSGELRIGSVMGGGGEVFGWVSYRGNEGLGLVHALLTQMPEPSPQQFMNGMNCLKLDLCRKGELTDADLARLNSVDYKSPGKGNVWPAFHSMRPSWMPVPVNQEEAIQLTEDLLKVVRFSRWFAKSAHLHSTRQRLEIPVVGLGEHPLTSEEIDWMPLLPPIPIADEPLTLSEAEIHQLAALPVRAGVSEVEATFLPAGSFLDESGRRRVPQVVIMSDQASYFVQAVELFFDNEPLPVALRKIVMGAMIDHRMRPERIQVRDERLFRILQPAAAKIRVQLERVDELIAAPDALESLASHMRGTKSKA